MRTKTSNRQQESIKLMSYINRHIGYAINELNEILFIGPAIHSKHYRETLADEEKLSKIVGELEEEAKK